MGSSSKRTFGFERQHAGDGEALFPPQRERCYAAGRARSSRPKRSASGAVRAGGRSRRLVVGGSGKLPPQRFRRRAGFRGFGGRRRRSLRSRSRCSRALQPEGPELRPSKATWCRPARWRARVVLPDPEGPMMPTRSPASIRREMSWRSGASVAGGLEGQLLGADQARTLIMRVMCRLRMRDHTTSARPAAAALTRMEVRAWTPNRACVTLVHGSPRTWTRSSGDDDLAQEAADNGGDENPATRVTAAQGEAGIVE